MNKGRGAYQMLKCNFHTHYYESYGKNAIIMVDAHRDADYDCLALTEHFCFLTDLQTEKAAQRYAQQKYGKDLLVVIGQEATFQITDEHGVYCKDVVALFLNEAIQCEQKVTSHPTATPGPLISAETGFCLIHEQGGIGVVAHDNFGTWYDRYYGRKERGLWVWDRRRELPIDAWEIGNGWARFEKNAPGLELMLSHPQESVNEGYIVLANSDAHNAADVSRLGVCATYVFVTERSIQGVKEALINRRTVADCDGQLFGRREWIELWHALR